jgi:prolyl-tRNA editing enzyme YbaK/EbsC (Cys-tRNA(Pro) deacylase)
MRYSMLHPLSTAGLFFLWHIFAAPPSIPSPSIIVIHRSSSVIHHPAYLYPPMYHPCLVIALLSILLLQNLAPPTTAFCRNHRNPTTFPSSISYSYFSTSYSAATNDDDGTTINHLSALEFFLSTCNACNEKYPGSIQIISRASSSLPPHQEIKTSIFTARTATETTTGSNYDSSCLIIAILKNIGQVDEFKLRHVLSIPHIKSVPMGHIPSLCGFALSTVPPLGHLSKFPVKIVIDKSLIKACQSKNQEKAKRIKAAAGHPYWQCLVAPNVLESLPNSQVAAFASTHDDDSDSIISNPVPFTISPAPSAGDASPSKPFFSLETPPMQISRLVVEQKYLSNPLVPLTNKAIGQLGSLERKTKKMLTCDLLPPFVYDNGDDTKEKDPLPWRSGFDRQDMSVKLIFGKALFQQLGATQGDVALQNLDEGQVAEITLRTRVGNRDSLKRWTQHRCLDLEVLDYQILAFSEHTNGNYSSAFLDVNSSFSISSANKPFKHKPPSHSTAASPQLPFLTINDVFADSGSLQVVDSMSTLKDFARKSSRVLVDLDNNGKNEPNEVNQTLSTTMMGMDCEWQPNQLSARGELQPVLLLQISFHSLGKVYLLDLKTMLRPLLSADEPMNETELLVSETLTSVFISRRILKTGYQIASDLRRIATSYPHIPCFQEIEAVLEIDTLVKRVLQLTKQKKSRSITMSLARLTAHYLGKSVSKEYQVSNWSGRPLSEAQKEYASLDAAISPVIAEKALQSINASINGNLPRIERWYGDEGISKAIDSWRFLFLQIEDEEVIRKLQAKQVVGPSWVVTQSWITGCKPPQVPSVPPINGESFI